MVTRRRHKWEEDWRIESERPEAQLATTVPSELIAAVREGWFIPGSSILDIGSGRGQISAALAQRGFTVVGADLAEEATQLAQRHFSHLGTHLTFRTMDICVDPPEPERFDAFLDRGCFHGLPPQLQQRYVENVFTSGKPGARLLLFHMLASRRHSPTRQWLVEHIKRTFGLWFDIDKADQTLEPLQRSAGAIPRRTVPGMVFRMSRRAVRPELTHRRSSGAETVKINTQFQSASQERVDPIPSAIRIVLGTKWWTRGMRLLDIRCGEGVYAASFAKEGLDVLAVDAAPQRIARARNNFRDVERLRFEVMDIHRAMTFAQPFDALLDHGCLARLDAAERATYAATMAAAAKPGARFLLLLPAPGGKQELQQLARSVRRFFASSFELLDAQIAPFARPATGAAIRGVAFRFVRR